MPPKGTDAIDSLITDVEGNYGFWDLLSNWYKLTGAETPEGQQEALLEFYKYADAGPYQKTYVPGEHELLARMLGIEDLVNEFMFTHTSRPRVRTDIGLPEPTVAGDDYAFDHTPPLAYETLINAWKEGRVPSAEDIMERASFRDEPWDEVMQYDAPSQTSTPGMGRSYSKEQSPLVDFGDYFGVNSESMHGKDMQDRLNYIFTAAKLNNLKSENPDTGEMMYRGEDPLLGSVYFNEFGDFTDVWDIAPGKHEPLWPEEETVERGKDPLLINKLQSFFYNIGREKAGPDYQKNIPIVKGRAYLLGEIEPYIGIQGM